MNERRLLLTGATGFVGGHLIRYCQTHFPGWKLFALVREGSQFSETPASCTPIHQSELKDSIDKHRITDIIHLAGKAHDTTKTSDPQPYFSANFDLTKSLFDSFIGSSALSFIFLSTIKSIHHQAEFIASEDTMENPVTPYGKSKRQAEEYISSQPMPSEKRYFILRPVLVYGPSVKGNLNALVKFVSRGFPYPFAAFENKRSYLSVNNLCFIVTELLQTQERSGVFNLANDEPLSTKEIIHQLAEKLNKKAVLINIPILLWRLLAKIGDRIGGPFDSEVLRKLTDTMVVDSTKIISTLKKPLPDQSHSSIGNIV